MELNEYELKEIIKSLLIRLYEEDNKINISQNTKVKLNKIKKENKCKNYNDTIIYLIEQVTK